MLRFFTPAQLALAVVLAILAIVPSVIILRRLGYSGWWAVFAAISPLNILGLWVLAFVRWPVEQRPSAIP